MKLTTTLLLCLFSLCLALAACKKNTNACTNTVAAVILDRGPVASDGCGWVVRIDSTDYHPMSLAASFQTDSLKANVSYSLDTSHFYCGLQPAAIPVIRVNCIERR